MNSNSYDQYHNTTLDAYTGSTMEWSIINMIRKVTPSGGSVAKYTFLADGTKARVNSSTGTYLYFGSMVFSIPASGSPAFESMSVAEGRIIATASGNEARYFITDHLGSVRTVLKADGTVVAENDFYPFGKRIPAGTAGGNACRHTFSGKEDQSRTPAGSPYLDFGARMYSPDCARWLSVDPMAEKYYGIGTHVYCAGDPVNYRDPDGNRREKIVNERKQTITICATYVYYDRTLKASLKGATDLINNTSYTYTNKKGKEYTVIFKLEIYDAQRRDHYLYKKNKEYSNRTNFVETVDLVKNDPQYLGGFNEDDGVTIQIKKDEVKDIKKATIIFAQEIGHSLGAALPINGKDNHSQSGLMTRLYEDVDISEYVFDQDNIDSIVEYDQSKK